MSWLVIVLMLLALGTWMSAMSGAAFIAIAKKQSSTVVELILGFAAGVILMVSFVELLHPAIHMSETHASLPAFVIVPGAFTLGFAATFLLDYSITRTKEKGEPAGVTRTYKQGVVLFGALSAHNIPEGLALGVLLAVGSLYRPGIYAVIPLVAAVALHKLPEGAAIALAFKSEGMSNFRSFLVGQASGFFGFLAGLAGLAVALNINTVLPYAMAFAAGAMVWVAVHELIPESKKNKHKKPYLATIGIFLGVLLMLFVDTTLHDHGHSPRCGYHCCDYDQLLAIYNMEMLE